MGCWDLVVPSDVCGARRRLRAAAAVKAISGAPPDHSVDAPVEVIEEAVEELLLVFEELASNALRHSWPPQPAVDRDPALGGLGLHLVARLSSDYGWSVQGGRKHVWACLPTPSARPATGGDVSAA